MDDAARVALTGALLLTALACRPAQPHPAPPVDTGAPRPPNLLVVVVDDLGVDKLASYGLQPRTPATPTLDGLAASGRSYDHAWGYPVCSPSRAAMLTGRHPVRTGIGVAIQPQRDAVDLDPALVALPELLRRAPTPYTSFAVGKWHLGVWANDARHPYATGFDRYAGSLANLRAGHARDGEEQSYVDWEKSTLGTRFRTETYATTDTTDEALAAMAASTEPWFGWVAFNAPHAPYHAPPATLRPGPEPVTVLERYDAMVEALDVELGRLLGSIDPARTVVVVVSDNGTPGEAVEAPLTADHAKHSLYEGGVRVPLIVTGPGVAPGRSAALVGVVDLYATLGELAGVPVGDVAANGVDSVSFASELRGGIPVAPREYVYAELLAPNGPGPYDAWDRAIRDARYKLVSRLDAPDELYDLGAAWLEGTDLLATPPTGEALAAADRLRAARDAVSAP